MTKKWWHEKVAYQIYPKSFMDSNGDGIGDLPGIISKLDYLKDLGIDIIWISPIYSSPFVDQGYDISDYRQIAECFGTMEDFDRLLAEAKKRDMYIVMDLVVNHCSSEHEWFKKALADPDGEYGKYFYIQEGVDGHAPTNHRSYFGGPAWEQIPGTNKYYLHLFAKEQPDLNWNNVAVREQVYDMVNWWFEKGIAGFRIDAIINIGKKKNFITHEADGPDGLYNGNDVVDQEAAKVFLAELKEKTFDKWDAFTVGEVFDITSDDTKDLIGENGVFSSMFDFSAHIMTFGEHGWYDAPKVENVKWRDVLFASQQHVEKMGGFASNIIENHDEPRGVCRYLQDYAINDYGKKALAATSILFRGLPFLFMGQEIGTENVVRHSIDEYDDISTKDEYRKAIEAGCSVEEALKACYDNSRDNGRTPMQWDSTPNGGFTTGTPWLGNNPKYEYINVADQEKDEDSVLNYYKKLIALRKSEAHVKTFTYGHFEPMCMEYENVMAYKRVAEDDSETIIIAANFGDKEETIKLDTTVSEMLLSNMKDTNVCGKVEITLRSLECIVVK